METVSGTVMGTRGVYPSPSPSPLFKSGDYPSPSPSPVNSGIYPVNSDSGIGYPSVMGIFAIPKYTTKFTEMARFAEHQVATKEWRIERYIWGLRSGIREFVLMMRPASFQSAVEVV